MPSSHAKGAPGEDAPADHKPVINRHVYVPHYLHLIANAVTSGGSRIYLEKFGVGLNEGRIAAENAVLGTRRRFTHDIVPTGSFTDPEYGSIGLTESEARARYDCAVGVVRYEDLLRPVADGRPDGFCKLIVESRRRYVLGAHVLGEYSAEVIQMVAACMAANLRVEQIAELQLAFPTFTEAVGTAAQLIVQDLGIAPIAPSWSSLVPRS